MPSYLAVDLAEEQAQFAAADLDAVQGIKLLAAGPMELESSLNDIPLEELDGTLAVLSATPVIFEQVSLPFGDPKRIEQTLPLQIQDLVPFEIEPFALSSMVLGEKPEGGYEILSSLVNRDALNGSLARLKEFGLNPKTLTVKACAVTGLKQLCADKLGRTFSLVVLDRDRCTLAVFVQDRLRQLREFRIDPARSKAAGAEELVPHIRCSIARIEHETKQPVSSRFFAGDAETAAEFQARGLSGRQLDLSRYVHALSPAIRSANEMPWAVGLFALELAALRAPGRGLNLLKRPKLPVVNFQREEFALTGMFPALVSALRDEGFYLILALVLAVGWIAASIYNIERTETQVEQTIHDTVAKALPGVSIPPRREFGVLNDRIQELETKLSELGSLSSLSPLGSLKEISLAIPMTIDVTVDGMNIGDQGFTLRGSVADMPSVGRLSGALEARKDRFCEVRVDPKGRTGGANRVGFIAEVKFCK